MILLLWACAPDPEPVDPGPEAQGLALPDTTGIDFAAAFAELLEVALAVQVGPAWQGNVQALGEAEPGCPDLYVGKPDPEEDEAQGLSWSDRCSTSGGLDFGGHVWWTGAVEVSTDEAAGTTTQASRALEADGVVAQGDEVLFELDGEAEEGLLRIEDGSYTRWSWSSALNTTVTGTWPFGGGALAGGWRSDLNLSATGGDVDSLALSGDTFLFDARLAERFDSFSLDITLSGPTGAGPEDCLEEPLGWMALRTPDAYWFDLVFEPEEGSEDYENQPYAGCDGCGTLYIRGQEQPEPVCLDLSWVWAGALTPPEATDAILTLRDLEVE